MGRSGGIPFIERAVTCVSQGRLRLPRNVGDGTGLMLYCHEGSHNFAKRNRGARVADGWTANGTYRIRRAELALFQYDSVVEPSRVELVDPNRRLGQEELFAEDVTRADDDATRTARNSLAIADRPFHRPVSGASLPASNPIWRTHHDDTVVYSGDPRHARWHRFDRGEEWRPCVANLELEPQNSVDVTVVTNLEFVFGRRPKVMGIWEYWRGGSGGAMIARRDVPARGGDDCGSPARQGWHAASNDNVK